MSDLYELLGIPRPSEEEMHTYLACEDCGHDRYQGKDAVPHTDDVTKPCPCEREGCFNFHCANCNAVRGGFGPVGCDYDPYE